MNEIAKWQKKCKEQALKLKKFENGRILVKKVDKMPFVEVMEQQKQAMELVEDCQSRMATLILTKDNSAERNAKYARDEIHRLRGQLEYQVNARRQMEQDMAQKDEQIKSMTQVLVKVLSGTPIPAPICAICFAEEVDCVITPCFCAKSCRHCTAKLTNGLCPFCRVPIVRVKDLFL